MPSLETIVGIVEGDQSWTDRLVLVAVDGQWLIDEVEPIDPLP